jgi:CheY-like chemotaxis protein
MNTGSRDAVRVLYVDDDPAFLDLASRFLERVDERLRVVTAEDVSAALDRLRTDDRIECVLSDYEMPGTDGLAFFERVKEVRPRLPFVLYTNRDDDAVVAEALQAGVSDCVRKDVDRSHYRTLGTRLRREVRRVRAEVRAETRLVALEAASEGLCVTDDRGRVQYANRAYLDHYGFDRDDVCGKVWQTVHPDEVVSRLPQEVPRLDARGEWAVDGDGVALGDDDASGASAARLPDGGLVIRLPTDGRRSIAEH